MEAAPGVPFDDVVEVSNCVAALEAGLVRLRDGSPVANHSFLDGNGRVGRLLVALILHNERVLTHPLLYLSLYFKQRRSEHDERLGGVRTDGDWEGWLQFFVQGVTEVAENAVSTARRLTALVERDRERVRGVGRGAATALQVHEAIQRQPIATIPRLAAGTRLSVPGATAALERLVALGLVREVSGRQRGRVCSYTEDVALLSEGTEPL